MRRIRQLREKEIYHVFRRFFLESVTDVSWMCSSTLTVLVTLAMYALLAEKPLDAPTAFTCLALIGVLQSPLGMIPYTINMFIDMSVSSRRLCKFFHAEESTVQTLGADAAAAPLELNGCFRSPASTPRWCIGGGASNRSRPRTSPSFPTDSG